MSSFAYQQATRRNILGIYAAHTPEQLNAVPAGFNNNLLWNAGHVVATMELLTYGLAGLPTPSPQAFIDRYRKGSRPTEPATAAEIDRIATELRGGGDRLREDLDRLDFSSFREYTTSYGVTLRSIEEALSFNALHEALHLGAMLQLRRLV